MSDLSDFQAFNMTAAALLPQYTGDVPPSQQVAALLPAPAKPLAPGQTQRREWFTCPDCGAPLTRQYGGRTIDPATSEKTTVYTWQCNQMLLRPHSRMLHLRPKLTIENIRAISRNRRAYAIGLRTTNHKSFEREAANKPRVVAFATEAADIERKHRVLIVPARTGQWPDNIEAETVLRFMPGKPGTTQKPQCHIVIAPQDVFVQGSFRRQGGDPLCKPWSKWQGRAWSASVPDRAPICPQCAERAERYDLMPADCPIVMFPSARQLTADSPDVTYQDGSKWFGYDHAVWAFPFARHLRRWRWLMDHCLCAHCRCAITRERSAEPIKGIPARTYYQCTHGHAIKDERDLVWKPTQASGDAAKVKKAYPWLQAAPVEDSPF